MLTSQHKYSFLSYNLEQMSRLKIHRPTDRLVDGSIITYTPLNKNTHFIQDESTQHDQAKPDGLASSQFQNMFSLLRRYQTEVILH